jgi:peptide/nickel transport system ATP-binding protein
MALLELSGIGISFHSRRGRVDAVHDLALTVERGEVLGVVGESGAGKSTIGNAIMGLIEPPGEVTAGDIRFAGQSIRHLSPAGMRQLRGRRIGMIFQDPMSSLNPLMTIGEQIVETIRQHLDLSAADARRKAIDLLRDVEIPEPETRIDHYPHQLSGGQRQRVVITLALCAEPDLVIADEPTTALDVSVQAQILELLRRLVKARDIGVIFITHDIGVIAEITDRVAVMYRGRVVEVGPTAQILNAPRHPYTISLMAAVPRPDRKLDRFPLLEFHESEGPAKHAKIDVRSHWLGQAAEEDGADAGHGPLLRVEHVSKHFVTRASLIPSWRRSFAALDDVGFDIAAGETLGVVGESGSGKSTIARVIAGLYGASAGSIHYKGLDITQPQTRAQAAWLRRQIQMVFQDPYASLNRRMRVRDIIAEPIRYHRLAGSAAEIDRIVTDLLDHVELGAAAGNRYPHEFSGGQRQRISIARALATRPRFLICDEPTSALDVSIQAQVLNLLKDLQSELGLTMLFISHDLPVIRQMCDRIAVMKGGRLVELAETERFFANPRHDYSRHLLSLMPNILANNDRQQSGAPDGRS